MQRYNNEVYNAAMRIKWTEAFTAGVILVSIFSLGACTPRSPASDTATLAKFGPASLRASASDLKGTIVTSHLDQEIPPGKNVLWCATFQLAWNELMDYAGGPVTMPKPPVMVDALNRRGFDKSDIDPDSCVTIAGQIAEDTLVKARKEIARKFPGISPELLPAAKEFPPDAVMMYAFLAKQLPFKYAFERADCLEFSADSDSDATSSLVAAFGFQYLPDNAVRSKQGRQVRILWHRFVDEKEEEAESEQFIVELLTTVKDERLILATIPPRKTLGQTVSEAMRLIEKPNTLVLKEPPDEDESAAFFKMTRKQLSSCACMLSMENLTVPVLDFDIRREFSELYKQTVVAKNLKVNGLPFMFAKQQIRFRLDETGAALKSEALGGMWGGPPRNFSFNRPFLIMLLRRGASKPYFALWVGNSELLVKAPAKED